MKKIFSKDKKNRNFTKKKELQHYILKQISNDSNFSKTINWNSFNRLTDMSSRNSKTYVSNRCIKTINKKSFNRLSNFSRSVFLKVAKSGLISGIRKSSW